MGEEGGFGDEATGGDLGDPAEENRCAVKRTLSTSRTAVSLAAAVALLSRTHVSLTALPEKTWVVPRAPPVYRDMVPL